MKTYQIIIIILLFGIFAIIVGTFVQSDTYSDFAKAKENKNKEHQIQIDLAHNKEIKTMLNNNSVAIIFYGIDKNNDTTKIFFKGAKPQDFEKAEKIVIKGKHQDSLFYASEMVLKCPSKYTNNKTGDSVMVSQ